LELDLNLQKELIDAITSLNSNTTWIYSPVVIAFVAGFFATLGGVLTHCFNIYSEKSRQQNEASLKRIESDIRKQEHIQEKQLIALSNLSKISHKMQPTIWSNPDFDSDDAYANVVFSMHTILSQLDEFLESYGYIVPDEIVTQLNIVMFKCNDTHWGASLSNDSNYEPTNIEKEAAKDILKFLSSAVSDFKKALGVINA